MISMKIMKWAAAGILAGAPAIGLARVHHITTAAAPLAAVTVTPSTAVKHTAVKRAAVKHKRIAVKHHIARKVVKHVAKPKVTAKHRAKVKSKKH